VLRSALEATLSNNGNVHSLFVRIPGSTRIPFALHATMKPSKKWFDLCIRDLGSVERVVDLKMFKFGNDELDNAKFPGPLIQCLLVDVQETKTAGVVINGNHSVFDGLSNRLFREDLNKALSSEDPSLSPHVPYKVWAETYYFLRDSPQAKASVAWHISQLSKLSQCKGAVWPPLRSLQTFWGASNTNWKGWTSAATASKYQNPDRQSLNKVRCDDTEGININFEIPAIKKLPTHHSARHRQIRPSSSERPLHTAISRSVHVSRSSMLIPAFPPRLSQRQNRRQLR
jgi:hypothetical protein